MLINYSKSGVEMSVSGLLMYIPLSDHLIKYLALLSGWGGFKVSACNYILESGQKIARLEKVLVIFSG